MDNLYICRIADEYINYLRQFDPRVPYNKGQRRPYLGVVLTVAAYSYFVPMESPQPNHANIKPNIHILKLDGGRLGLLGFNNMIPVPSHAVIRYELAAEPNVKYRNLVLNQLNFCNRNKYDIARRAHDTYAAVTEKQVPFFRRISCDFNVLEQACDRYPYPSR